MTTYFASDFHLDHDRDFIYGPRGFNNRDEHKDWILKECDSLDTLDELWYLGDFSLNSTPEKTWNYLRRIPCKKHLIWGNHEGNTRRIFNEFVKRNFGDGVEEVYPLFIPEINTVFHGYYKVLKSKQHPILVLSHFPHLIWDYMSKGSINLCGHSHGNCIQTSPSNTEGKIIDIGVDNCKKLFNKPFASLDQVLKIAEQKTVLSLDHHAPEKE